MHLVLTDSKRAHVLDALRETVRASDNFSQFEKKYLEGLWERMELEGNGMVLLNPEREMLHHSVLDVIVNSDTLASHVRAELTDVYQTIRKFEEENGM